MPDAPPETEAAGEKDGLYIVGIGPGDYELITRRAEAVEVIRRSIDDYRDRFGAPEARTRRLREILGATATEREE